MSQLPLLLDRSSRESLTDQIVGQLRQAIMQNQLPRGTQLPSSRRLCEQLEVARNTVIRAYEVLAMEGLVESRPASGIFVAGLPAEIASPRPGLSAHGAAGRSGIWAMPPPAVPVRMPLRAPAARGRLSHDFAPGRAHPALFPLKLWRRLLLYQLAHGGAAGLTEPGEPNGLPALRSAIAVYLATARGIVADASRIIVTSGVQEGISLAARLFLHQGTTAAIEDPCASGAALAFAATGSELVGVGVDEAGLLPDDLPQRPTALLYVTPSHQFPTGHVLSLERRDAIVAWARRCGCYILEDDCDGEFRYEGSPLKAIAAVAPDCTVYLGTFSRTLGAGLRLGFMLVPQRLVEAVAAAKDLLDTGNAWLEQAALAEMMQGPSYATHVARVRAHYKENRDCLLTALRRNFGDVSVSGEGSGLHLLWHLPPGIPDAASIEALARRHRIGVYSLASGGAAAISASLMERRALLLGFGSLLPKQIDQGIDRLSEIIDDTIDDPATDVTEFLVGVPQRPASVPRTRNRAASHLDSRFRHRPALPNRPSPRASLARQSANGAAPSMALVTSIYRYPVKGLSAQPLAQADLEAGKPLRYDRVFALARPTAPIDRDNPKWAKKGLFAMLMLDEGLARVSTHLDVDTLRLSVRRGNQQVASGSLGDAQDCQALENFFWTLLPNFSAPPVLVRSQGGHFMDKPDNVLSLINLATVRALEKQWGAAVDPLRFRANIYVDGARPWEEFDWVGQEIRIGGTLFSVDRKNGRCGATNVNPATGRRDLDIPSALRASFGHKNLGVYLVVRQNGSIAVGDSVAAPHASETRATHEIVASAPARPQRRFICRGCYFIYDEGTGLPQQGLGPGSFERIADDWRCPDCGSEKAIFQPYVDTSTMP
jgi:GntR family transcriptional regulator/MocR family aminotransferase